MSSIVILTGAGISAESGLATFRDADGLWARFRPQDLATPEAFARDPDVVLGWYDARRAQLDAVQPNAAHLALARLDREWPGDLLLVTQNVDDLHSRAGSTRMVQMHGALRRARCTVCEAVLEWRGAMPRGTACPACGAGTGGPACGAGTGGPACGAGAGSPICGAGTGSPISRAAALRPDIVWFGEVPMEMPRIMAAVQQADLFVSIGTSGTVYPAAGFVNALRRGARSLELNLVNSGGDFTETRQGPATLLVPAFVAEMLCA